MSATSKKGGWQPFIGIVTAAELASSIVGRNFIIAKTATISKSIFLGGGGESSYVIVESSATTNFQWPTSVTLQYGSSAVPVLFLFPSAVFG